MRNDRVRQIIVALATLLVIIVNVLANALPLNNLTTGEISDRFDVYFTPAAYVFSIWGLIYLGLIAYSAYQALSAQRTNPRLRTIAPWYVLSCVANVVWLFLWHYEQFPFTVIAMLTLLGSLLVIYLRLGIFRRDVPLAEGWGVHVPFSLYLGWVTVATIANISAVLDWAGWGRWGIADEIWALIMLVVAAALGAAVAVTRRDAVFPLVTVWSLVGIAVNQSAVAAVATPALGLAVLVALVWLVVVFLRLRERRPSPGGGPSPRR
ncbi:MAG TPA: tryptophan-rich sensory protein [Chloroflexi bacterium]|jgi:hypothetical protein|nr:tryptophan-rich sensory protein [Chloroflexota bacterium]